MRSFGFLAALVGSALAAPHMQFGDMKMNRRSVEVVARENDDYTVIKPGSEGNFVVTAENTLNGTYHSDETFSVVAQPIEQSIRMSLVNNLGDNVNSYISGMDSDGRVFFFGNNGAIIYPSSGGSTVPVPITDPNLAIRMPPQGQTLDIEVPIAFTSGRIYFVEGELQFAMVGIGGGRDGLVQPSINNPTDPSRNLNWGFVELTLTVTGEIWSNISYVDFIGIIMSMRLESTAGDVQEVIGLPPNGVELVCEGLAEQQARDGMPWAGMCLTRADGTPLRVVSPEDYEVLSPGAFAGYYNDYVDAVWDKYRSEPLTINTQAAAGEVQCRVVGELLQCDGDNRGYVKPTTDDIWGCNSGPFTVQAGDNGVHQAVVPRLCAAFVRTTLLQPGGNYQPGQTADEFYPENPTMHYSRIVHENQVDGKGYAFPYDDVLADGQPDPAGLVTTQDPELLTFYVGGI